MTSLVLHLVLAFVAGIYPHHANTTFPRVHRCRSNPTDKTTEAYRTGNPLSNNPIKPTVPTRDTIIVEQVPVNPRVTTVFRDKDIFQPKTVLEFSHQTVKVEAPINPNVPKVVTPNAPVPDSRNARGAASIKRPLMPCPSLPPWQLRPPLAPANIGRGCRGQRRPSESHFLNVHPASQMVQHVGAVNSSIDDVNRKIHLGAVEVPPAPRGEPHGHVIGRGKDIRGVFRFTRIRHSLSDWWADASSLNALTHWLNERTKIKTDMNVEGGALKLTDANLLKSPLVFMTGHDPSLVRSRNLLGRQYGGGKLDGRLSEAEAAGLRHYLVEKGGFLVFDDCGCECTRTGDGASLPRTNAVRHA